MALLPSVHLLPLTLSGATAPASSPLSVHRPRLGSLPFPRVRCRDSRTPHPAAAAARGKASASWDGKLAGAVPWKAAVSGALAVALSFTCFVGLANARTGVNKPELLPKEFTTVIDVAGFLSSGQENRLRQEIEDLEKDTGYKLRVLAQNYPDTPGLAIKDYWQVDERTIVFVADPTFGNIINFNIGPLVDLDVPRSFWSQVAGKYGNMFYWKEKGEDASIEAAVTAISRCLRDPTGTNNCSEGICSGFS
ncbi:hypothetical protein U9M48_031103 [Paspalum notatum var. saurae]|uniref:TPM domain-containing protein n=1 Tax=Paspalum notatum var. saurae TaxID=547442 RepID=A0AAQ3U666_PASNO